MPKYKETVRLLFGTPKKRSFAFAAVFGILLAIVAFCLMLGIYVISPSRNSPQQSVRGSVCGFVIEVGDWVAGFVTVFLILLAVICWIHSSVSRACD